MKFDKEIICKGCIVLSIKPHFREGRLSAPRTLLLNTFHIFYYLGEIRYKKSPSVEFHKYLHCEGSASLKGVIKIFSVFSILSVKFGHNSVHETPSDIL